jgi:hypothetical protein
MTKKKNIYEKRTTEIDQKWSVMMIVNWFTKKYLVKIK